jgi:hypothetical protein
VNRQYKKLRSREAEKTASVEATATELSNHKPLLCDANKGNWDEEDFERYFCGE